jgi:penicillin-binding protein 1A
VLAMVGGIDYNKSQYNRATQAKRQAGSVFKLFVYLSAMENGYNPDDVVVDEPFRVGKWQPKNYKNEYNGAVSLRLAVAKSLNTVAVRLSQYVGVGEVIKVAKRLGVRSPLNNMPSLALGAADVSLKDMVTAYAHLANGGRAVAPFGVLKVVRKSDGKVLYQRDARDNFDDIQVIAPENVAKMNSLLKGVLEFGTGKGAQIGRDAAGKTGTTSDYRDAWFIGYTPQIVGGIWVGNDDNSQMKGVTGGAIPARIWRDLMAKSHQGLQLLNLPIYVPPAPVFAPNPSRDFDAMMENAPKNDNFELQPSFWDKLLGE